MSRLQLDLKTIAVVKEYAGDAANLSDAGTLLPNDQLVIWRDGVMLRMTVAAFGGGREPTPTQLMLIPTGAIETADGEFQRFATDGSHIESIDVGGGAIWYVPIFYADLPPADRQYDLQVEVKMPSDEINSSVVLFFAVDALLSDALVDSGKNYLLLELRSSNDTTILLLMNQDDADNPVRFSLTPKPTVGSVVSLTTSATTVDLVWDGGSHSVNLPIGFFASAPNLLAMSLASSNSQIVPLSIKVYEA